MSRMSLKSFGLAIATTALLVGGSFAEEVDAELEAVRAKVDGMFEICGEVFGITFTEIATPVWHPDVKVYRIDDAESGRLLGHYYADLHPRPGKYSHAACWRLRPGVAGDDGYRTAVAAVAANRCGCRHRRIRHGVLSCPPSG